MDWKSHLEGSLEDGFYFTKKEWSETYVAGQNKIVEGFTISKEVAIVEANISFHLQNKDMSEFSLLHLGELTHFSLLLDITLPASRAHRCTTRAAGGSSVNVNATKILIKMLKPNFYSSLLFLPLRFNEGWVLRLDITSPSEIMHYYFNLFLG